jgi:hypothetical protein
MIPMLTTDAKVEIADLRDLLETLTQTQGMYFAHTTQPHAQVEQLVEMVVTRLQRILES